MNFTNSENTTGNTTGCGVSQVVNFTRCSGGFVVVLWWSCGDRVANSTNGFVQLVVISWTSTCGDICSNDYSEFYHTISSNFYHIYEQLKLIFINELSNIQNTTYLRKDGINPHNPHMAGVPVNSWRPSMV